eukprot:TRINITY_DN47464_c1_g1_i4.p1 TRINITY_DN47464_c1_g1~~TRINITY_DN47464_c1_g1_i4.p1  ORF type:complete len:325 (-),score=61.62 TRINITY_DN47464_c1_g1_i4:364-1338(-)
MPSAPLLFRVACGGFLPVYISFMSNRAKFKAAMFQRVLTLRSRTDGVMTGVLLFLLYMGNLIHQCGDIELNPGPPKQDTSYRQTRLTSGGMRRDSGGRVAGEKSSDDPTLKDVMSVLTDLSAKFDDMRNDMADLKQSHTDLKEELHDMRDTIDSLKSENGSLKNDNSVLKTKVDDLEKKVDDLESRSKRNNLIIHGIPKHEKETWQDCEELVGEMITDKLEMSDSVQFDRVHRLNSSPKSPMVARCTFFKDKEKMLKVRAKLKGSGIFINEDFSFKVREIRRKLIPYLKAAKEQGKRVTMVYDHLVIEGKKYFIDAEDELKETT